MLPDSVTNDCPKSNGETPPPARRGGAPAGNKNRLQSGVSAWAKAGRIPRCYRALRRELREFATGLAAEVERAKGRPASMYELCVVSSVVRHSGRVALLERWLAREHATLSVSDRLALLKEVGSASSSRDKALQSLGLDRDAETDSYGDYLAGRTTAAITHVDGATATTEAAPAADASNSVLRDGGPQ